MKGKRIYVIFIIAIMVLFVGCGNTGDTTIAEDSASETVETGNSDVADKEIVESENSFTEAKDINSMIVEKDDSELNLKEYYYSFEDRTLCNDGEDVFGSVSFSEADSLNYVTTGKVPVYAQNGVKIGHTKENVDIIVMKTYDDWCGFYLDKDYRYARLSDIEANAITMDERDAKTEEANKQEEATVKAETTPVENVPVENPVVDTPPATNPVEETPTSDKYTPEEAIAVYRSLMEAGGITWDPSIKDVTSWGTGFIYLDKGYPEWAASTDLESFAIGGHGGKSWTKYYMEVTGSDDECVYFTQWSSN